MGVEDCNACGRYAVAGILTLHSHLLSTDQAATEPPQKVIKKCVTVFPKHRTFQAEGHSLIKSKYDIRVASR